MSFQLGATATKASEVRKALETKRDQQLRANQNVTPETAEMVRAQSDELESDLSDAGIAAAEAAVRKLRGASQFQVTVSGNRDGNQQAAVSVSVNAIP